MLSVQDPLLNASNVSPVEGILHILFETPKPISEVVKQGRGKRIIA
jgi:hypothetical protein